MFLISEVARFLRISTQTLQRWDKSGKFKAKRTIGNQRWYSKEKLLSFLGLGEDEFVQTEQRKKSTKINYLYARVSSDLFKKIGIVSKFFFYIGMLFNCLHIPGLNR